VMLETCKGLIWKSLCVVLKSLPSEAKVFSAVMPPQPNHHSITFMPDLIGTEASGFGVGVGPPAAPAAGAVVGAAAGAVVGAAAGGAVGAAAGAVVGAAAPAAGAVVGAAAGAAAAGAVGADGAVPPPQALTRIMVAAVEPNNLKRSRRRREDVFTL